MRASGIWSNIIDFVSLLYCDLARTYKAIDRDSILNVYSTVQRLFGGTSVSHGFPQISRIENCRSDSLATVMNSTPRHTTVQYLKINVDEDILVLYSQEASAYSTVTGKASATVPWVCVMPTQIKFALYPCCAV